ncbi:hypothetical protein [Streptomyces sp. NPDC093111]|uniref:hypothetical protein n=1 Tax=Streptomyces sp. NPDC093111 TaxID=3154978 RepID=UPI00341EA318
MATQLHVAYSGEISGSAVFASGPYNCARSAISSGLSPAALAALDRSGTTQVRLGFAAVPAAKAYLFVNQAAPVTLTVEYC